MMKGMKRMRLRATIIVVVRGRRILILKSRIGFRILTRPTDRIWIPDYRIRIPDICHIHQAKKRVFLLPIICTTNEV